MPSLLLVVFILQFALHLINTVGASTIDELLWLVYNKLPTPTSSNARRCQALKEEVVRLKRELGNTSAQDNFGKWAKLDRQHNKAMAEFQKLDGSLRTHQATFNSAVKTLRWLGTQGLRFVLQFWFAKSPMFWLPTGWVPHYVEWILSFPRAPLGSISIQVWTAACAAAIALASEAVAAMWVLVTRKPTPTAKQDREPMAFRTDQKPVSATGEKEL
ncbi:uncharacterized protein M421DRAFT_153509 [Didymella exigua CBS 183.55]|uniref:Uncharacterized protein n=1 Tax=Didymella exigua CBS 183.55 TaxID=1150837 RepID=A0A6A5RNW7_9PLEO|nr:uncharacterized protein M421DRAFT_153509 [Didymella exigua CBS 183.55]KAF1928724.1 hypothetical protein M421DRAFT_153509 [Didymella exigua CBS 183.55]